jgi:transcriptional repressor NrdR
MKCPFCEYTESKVIDSRPVDEGASIRRRRECLKCEKRFTTYEQVESVPLIVIKKDGKREVFNRQKLINGILHACEKTQVSYSQVENLVSEIESTMHNRLDKEIPSTEIGELVMAKLKVIDDIAYVRFASVYREFKDVNTFLEELNRILRK